MLFIKKVKYFRKCVCPLLCMLTLLFVATKFGSGLYLFQKYDGGQDLGLLHCESEIDIITCSHSKGNILVLSFFQWTKCRLLTTDPT